MSIVFCGVCSHGPGITARTESAEAGARERFLNSFDRMRKALYASKPDALVVIAAEHFANFFMNNMPSFAVGMADSYEGPIEDPAWLRIPRREVPGNVDISKRLIDGMMQEVDISYCEEWKFDHGIMVPLHHLTPEYDIPVIPMNINCQSAPMTPLHRAYAFGQAIRRAAERMPERIAVIGTGALSHWPCTPDTGTINEEWDRAFLRSWADNDREAMLRYTDEETYRDGGQGAYEMRTYIAAAGVAEGHTGEVWSYEPIPQFACGCTVGVMNL